MAEMRGWLDHRRRPSGLEKTGGVGRCGRTDTPKFEPSRWRVADRVAIPVRISGELAPITGGSIAARAWNWAVRAASSRRRDVQLRWPARWPAISTATHGPGLAPPPITLVLAGAGSASTFIVGSSMRSPGGRAACPLAAPGSVHASAPIATEQSQQRDVRPRPGKGAKPGGAIRTTSPPRLAFRSQVAQRRSVAVDILRQKRVERSTNRRSTESGGPETSCEDSQRVPIAVLGAKA